MSAQIDRIMMCPICLDPMTAPILQCQVGHSMCGDCITANELKTCPQCRGALTQTRNYQLEQLITGIREENIKSPCYFADRGCKYFLTHAEKQRHEAECKNRKFLCEGRKFAKWKCDWYGNFSELEDHFKNTHGSVFQYKMEAELDVKLDKDFHDIKIISFFNGSHYFWYKHKVDVAKQRAFWTFQYIGSQKQAQNYYYEFEINNGPTRKFKVTEVCDNDVVNAEKLFNDEKCISLSFVALNTYRNGKGKLPIKFRILGLNKHNEHSN